MVEPSGELKVDGSRSKDVSDEDLTLPTPPKIPTSAVGAGISIQALLQAFPLSNCARIAWKMTQNLLTS